MHKSLNRKLGYYKNFRWIFTLFLSIISISQQGIAFNFECSTKVGDISIDIKDYKNRIHGFWLGQNIGNWTGLITEMDKIGTQATMPFYTDNDWGGADQRTFWGEFVPHSSEINFYLVTAGNHWGADDDTDMEYLYAHLHSTNQVTKLTPTEIRDGWLKHIYSEDDAPFYRKFPSSEPIKENFLWVSNETARILMDKGFYPPKTSDTKLNPNNLMIDAQLTTEIFGLLAPANPKVALEISSLPIMTTARGDAALIASFYVILHSLAIDLYPDEDLGKNLRSFAKTASAVFPNQSTPAKILNFVLSDYENNNDKNNWESTRDKIYKRYQIQSNDGYTYKKPFDANINFAASLVSLFYGDGDFKRTIQIATLSGWDSDNPAATWGGLLGFILGKDKIKMLFPDTNLSETFWIHRTRRNFPTFTNGESGVDRFSIMAERESKIAGQIIKEKMNGCFDKEKERWIFSVN